MNSVLVDLQSTCPHCQHKFWRLKTVKGIAFCPNCECSLLKVKNTSTGWTVKELTVFPLIVFVIAYLMLSWSNYTLLQSIASNWFSYWYLYVLVGMYLLASSYVSAVKRQQIVIGVDSLAVVQADMADYHISTVYNDPNYIARCSHCRSQRLQNLYWYKKNLVNNKMDMIRLNYVPKDIFSDDFVGCLNCHHHFLEIKNPDKWALGMKAMKLVVIVVMLASWLLISFIFQAEFEAILDIKILSNNTIYILKALAIALVYILIAPLQSFIHRNPPPRTVLMPLS